MPISFKCSSCGKALTAPDAAAGKRAKCPACATVMPIPERVFDAEEIGAEEIDEGFRLQGEPDAAAKAGLSSEDPLAFLSPGQPADQPPPPAGVTDAQERRPCPICREMIVATAAKCRFCGAVLDVTLKRELEEKKYGKARKEEDENPSVWEWVFCVLCAGIACIVGIVYVFQGKPKGWKMIVASIACACLWGMVRAALESMQPGNPAFR